MSDDNFDMFSKQLHVTKTKNSLIIESEDDDEKAFVEDITQKTIRSIKKRRFKNVTGNVEIKATRKSRNNIKKHVDMFIKHFKSKNNNEKTINGYIKKFDLLIEYFNYINVLSLQDITKQHCTELQTYLLNFPTNISKQKELQGKNIFELIDKNDKLLDKYEKMSHRTVDNYITRYKTLFNFFLDKDFIYTNFFLNIKNLKQKSNNAFKDFLRKEDTRHFIDINEFELLYTGIHKRSDEVRKIIIFGLITGLRISEICNLKKIDILNFNEKIFIDNKQSKTENGIREIPIKDKFNFFIKDLINDKKDEDYVFYKNIKEDSRNDKIQKRVMYQIRKFIKDENKVFHSMRKSFTRLLYQSKMEELYIKILLGHSLKDNLSFNVYNLSEIDRDLMYDIMQTVSFEKYFHNLNFFPMSRKEKNIKKSINRLNNL